MTIRVLDQVKNRFRADLWVGVPERRPCSSSASAVFMLAILYRIYKHMDSPQRRSVMEGCREGMEGNWRTSMTGPGQGRTKARRRSQQQEDEMRTCGRFEERAVSFARSSLQKRGIYAKTRGLLPPEPPAFTRSLPLEPHDLSCLSLLCIR